MARTPSKARGYVTVAAGIFLVVLMCGVWIFVANLVATHAMNVSAAKAAAFLGQLYVAFATIVLCGLLGIANGVFQIRRQKNNRFLVFAIIVLFIAAGVMLFQASSLIPGS